MAKIKIDKYIKKYLFTGTQFWLEGANPSLSDLSSLKGVITGPTIILQPGDGTPSRHFVGLDHRPSILQSRDKLVHYTMSFEGAVGQIGSDAPVTLRGFTVGMVEGIALNYDAATHQLETPVTIALDPKQFHIRGGIQPVNGQWKPVMDMVLEQLIGEGMRGQLTQSPPLVGSYNVSLDFVAGASNAHLTKVGSMTQIPTASTSGANSIIQRVNNVPIDKIAQQILEITNQVREIVSSPSLHDSIKHLDHTLADLDRTVRIAGPQITQFVRSLRETAGEILDRPELVHESGANALIIDDRDRWGAPLGEMARNVLAQDLMKRLPQSAVILPDAPAPPSAAHLVVNVAKFDETADGRVKLDATWTLLHGNPATPILSRDVTLECKASGDDAESQAAAMSQLLGQLADSIATNLPMKSLVG